MKGNLSDRNGMQKEEISAPSCKRWSAALVVSYERKERDTLVDLCV